MLVSFNVLQTFLDFQSSCLKITNRSFRYGFTDHIISGIKFLFGYIILLLGRSSPSSRSPSPLSSSITHPLFHSKHLLQKSFPGYHNSHANQPDHGGRIYHDFCPLRHAVHHLDQTDFTDCNLAGSVFTCSTDSLLVSHFIYF